jgi:gamma-glutamyltranspeptidase / glutathione hydrolase
MGAVLATHRARLDSPFRSERSMAVARRGMVCASVPDASAAGVAMLARGGNAVDAALAAAAVLCVVEPMMTGVGGDAFVLYAPASGPLVGLNGSGRAPAAATLEAYRARGLSAMPGHGILSVTVPGAVHAWEALSERHGRLPLGVVLEPAIRAAVDGFAVSELVAHYWWGLHRAGILDAAAAVELAPDGRTPRAGEWFKMPALGRTLRAIAEHGAKGFYAGPVADAIVAASRAADGFLAHDDLASHQSTWVDPISTTYRGVLVSELPPNGQGLAALIALNLLEALEPAEPASALHWHRRIEAVKLAFADRDEYVADPERAEVPVAALLDKAYARGRAALVGERALEAPAPGRPGDTVYLCAADGEGNLVSFIQSLASGFGSGVGCGDTGVVLQNRGAGFSLDPRHRNALAPGKRPFHTIIPGMLSKDGAPWMAFGSMGGPIQPQSHLSFVANVVDLGLSPQEALDRMRFRFQGGKTVLLEAPDAAVAEGGTLAEALAARGHEIERPPGIAFDPFGGGQAIQRLPDGVLAGASDRRKDGCALGLY